MNDTKRIKSYDELLNLINNLEIKHDLELINKAYEFANKAHKGQKRINGEDYIIHCLNVAYLIASLKLDTISISCALLHDSIEKGKLTIQDIDNNFNTEITFIVDSLNKFRELTQNNKNNNELDLKNANDIRDLILNATEDIRVLIIRLAEKLDNINTIENLSEEIKQNTAKKNLNIYAPLCEYLGLGFFKRELEDNSFKILNPEEYKITKYCFDTIIGEKEILINDLKTEIQKLLIKANINPITIQTRIKGLYSAYKKVKSKYTEENKIVSLEGFRKLGDILAARIIVNTIEECYIVLGIIHSKWYFYPNRFDDYIIKPKSNGYRSIQTTIKYKNTTFEIQIRTKEMHEYNEFGPASHIAYKIMGGSVNVHDTLTWTKDLIKWQQNKNQNENIYKVQIFANSVFVFTPKGKLIRLPKGSTPIDFAFHIHLEIGLKYNGALVNGKMVNKEYELKTGDIIEILQSNQLTVSSDWLKIVKTQSTKQKIRKFLKLSKQITPK